MCRWVTICLTLSMFVVVSPGSSEQETTANALFKLMLLDDQDIADIKAGKIVAADRVGQLELKGSNLLGVVLARLEAPLEKTAPILEHTLNAALKRAAAFSAVLEERGPFPAVSFAPDEDSEAELLLKFKGGNRFNLSASEMQKLKSAPTSTQDGSALQAASEFMTEVLDGRFRSYVERGLDGIESYQRKKGKEASPGEELRLIDNAAKPFESYVPKFYQAVVGFPKKDPDLQYRYQVIKKTVSKRPAFVLLQRITDVRPEYVAVSQREFYVSHTYNSLAISVLIVPYEGQTLALITTDTFTERVTGATSAIAKPVGRKRIRNSVLSLMKRLKANAESG